MKLQDVFFIMVYVQFTSGGGGGGGGPHSLISSCGRDLINELES